ncbi:MAG: metal-dependent transcriptional regulator [Actinobacteria bacterium]|nr:metal-dependent transcriptional regulator [Cyanobacteriota bacterium]MCL6087328.1 metal-dependent transcriptional regulator [Actinomycetota bacterium]
MTELSHCLEDYLEAIYIIGIKKKVVRVKEIAEFLDVKTPSVVDAMSKLSEKNLINHEKYGYLNLSDEGIRIAKNIYKKHRQIYRFLNEILGMDTKTSEKDACGLEHHMSKNSMDKMIKLMEYIDSNPESHSKWLINFNNFIAKKK